MTGTSRVLAFALGVVLAAPAFACINETGTNRYGQRVPVEIEPEHLAEYLTYGDRENLVDWATEITRKARAEPNYDNHNQLAVALIRLGRPQPAIELLHVLDERHPGRYPTATNLGTAYELVGEDRKALEWIREGISRNPGSHDGSEWLHVRILEAKLGGTVARGPSVLGLDYGNAAMPVPPKAMPAGNDGRPVDPGALNWHFFVQLHERTGFVPPKDPVVARLFFDWGNNEMLYGAVETAEVAYGYALKYGHPDAALISKRRAEIERILDEAG